MRNDPLNLTDPTGRFPGQSIIYGRLFNRAVNDVIQKTVTEPTRDFSRAVQGIARGEITPQNTATVATYAVSVAVPEIAAERLAASVTASVSSRAVATSVRDAGLAGVTGRPAAAVGAFDPVTGQTAFATSGPVPDVVAPQMSALADQFGGVGAVAPSGNVVGCCAEFRAANALALGGSNVDNVVVSPAVRPRTGEHVIRCETCEGMFGPE